MFSLLLLAWLGRFLCVLGVISWIVAFIHLMVSFDSVSKSEQRTDYCRSGPGRFGLPGTVGLAILGTMCFWMVFILGTDWESFRGTEDVPFNPANHALFFWCAALLVVTQLGYQTALVFTWSCLAEDESEVNVCRFVARISAVFLGFAVVAFLIVPLLHGAAHRLPAGPLAETVLAAHGALMKGELAWTPIVVLAILVLPALRFAEIWGHRRLHDPWIAAETLSEEKPVPNARTEQVSV